MHYRFPVLSFISIVLRYVGWLIVLIGLYFAVYAAIIESLQAGRRFGSEDSLELAIGLALILFGLIGAASGEIIGVLFAIEENTRNAAQQPESVVGITETKGYSLKLCPSCNAFQDAQKIECPNCGHDLTNVAVYQQRALARKPKD